MHQPEPGWRMRMYEDFVRCKVRRTQSSVMCMGNGNGNHKHMRAEMSAIDINEERDGERTARLWTTWDSAIVYRE